MRARSIFAVAALALATACGGMKGGNSIPQTPDRAFVSSDAAGPISILKKLKTQVTIGSTVDPTNGDTNPHGLAVDGRTLYVCNFSDSSNKQGRGTTIVTLAKSPGSSPQHFAFRKLLRGCSSLVATPRNGNLYATAAMSPALDTYCTIVYCGKIGGLEKSNSGGTIVRPWSAVWADPNGYRDFDPQELFVSDATTGSILLAAACQPARGIGDCKHPMTPIVTGFAVNHGKPGSILGPSGLAFSRYNCGLLNLSYETCGTLFVVDGANNTIVAIHGVTNLRKANSIVVGKDGTTFSGPKKSWASLVYAGKPLNGPISAAVLDDDHLVVGNTTEPAGTNSLIEIALPKCRELPCPLGTVVDQVNVDKGAPGAIFGIAAARTKMGPVLYFNDDNSNTVQALLP